MKEFTYFLKFEDGTNFLSPDVRENDPKWDSERVEKSIRELYFRIGDKLFGMTGFEKYNFFVEASESFGGGRSNIRLERLFFCGAHNGAVVIYTVDLTEGAIIKDMRPEGEEYYGSATRGWRMGLFGKTPKTGTENL